MKSLDIPILITPPEPSPLKRGRGRSGTPVETGGLFMVYGVPKGHERHCVNKKNFVMEKKAGSRKKQVKEENGKEGGGAFPCGDRRVGTSRK